MAFIFPSPRATCIEDCFDHLSAERLYQGARVMEPWRHAMPEDIAFVIGKVGYIRGYCAGDTVDGLRAGPSVLTCYRGYCIERADCHDAVDAWREFTRRNGRL